MGLFREILIFKGISMGAVHVKTFLRKQGNIKSHSAIYFFSQVKIKFNKLHGSSMIHEKCISRDSFFEVFELTLHSRKKFF